MCPSAVMTWAVELAPSVTSPVLHQPDIVKTAGACRLFGHDLAEKHGGFDVTPFPARIVRQIDRDAVPLGPRAAQHLRLGEADKLRRQCLGIEKVAIRLAARDLQIDRAVPQVVAGDQFRLNACNLLQGERERDGELLQRTAEPTEMQIVIDHPPADHRRYLVDGIAEQKTPVKKPDPGFLLGYELTMDVDDPAHLFLPLRTEHRKDSLRLTNSIWAASHANFA